MRLTINVSGRPAPQGSKEQGAYGQMLESSAYLPAWRTAVKIGAYKAYAQVELPSDVLPIFPRGVPVAITRCVFYVGHEQCRADGTEEPTGTPDIDKLLRSTLDALGGKKTGSARLFADDSQIVAIDGLRKKRHGRDRGPGALIIITDEVEA